MSSMYTLFYLVFASFLLPSVALHNKISESSMCEKDNHSFPSKENTISKGGLECVNQVVRIVEVSHRFI